MKISNAPSVDDAGERECNVCGSEGTFVLYDGDTLCTECSHSPSARRDGTSDTDDWDDWFQHREEEYEGWYGEDRIKFVGGFGHAYDWGNDFDASQ